MNSGGYNWDSSAIVKPINIQKALESGNINGVRRLAKFVCSDSIDPYRIFEKCQEQRLQGVKANAFKIRDMRA